jgi:tRNA G10  N-methylase Trm11
MPRDVVLDPFCGSGTVFKAARDLGLEPIGIELDEKMAMYAKEAQK